MLREEQSYQPFKGADIKDDFAGEIQLSEKFVFSNFTITQKPLRQPGKPTFTFHPLQQAAPDGVSQMIAKRTARPTDDAVFSALMPKRLIIPA
jgi:hypothetical protein